MLSRFKTLLLTFISLQISNTTFALEEGTWQLGNFSISYEKGVSTGKIVVKDRTSFQQLWSSRFDQTIVEAFAADERVKFSRGSFSFGKKIHKRCLKQQVLSVTPSFDRVEIVGQYQDCQGTFSLTLIPLADGRLQLSSRVASTEHNFNHSALHYESSSNEAYYGFGTHYSRLNMKGELLPIWSQEQGIGRGRQPMSAFMNRLAGGTAGYWYTTYTGVPSYFSSLSGGLLVENLEYLEFDFSQEQTSSLKVWSNHISLQILRGAEPKEVLRNHTEVSGRMPPLPRWTQNGVIARGKGGSKEVRAMLAELKEAGTPVSAIWIEDWPGERQTIFGARVRWNWEVDRALYPDFEELIQDIRDSGIRVLTYFNPMLAQEKNKEGTGAYAYAEKMGYLVKNKKGKTYTIGIGGFNAALIDFTNPSAKSWMKSLIQDHIDLGVSGWLADFGETLPYDAQLHNGAPARRYHNQFVDDWVSLNRELIEENDLIGEGFFMSRSGTAKSPGRAMSFWIGDQNVTWDEFDGIKTVIPALLSSGLSGYSLETIDVGGWISISKLPLIGFTRSQELFLRWLDIGVFTSLLRFHHTNEPEKNHQYNTDQFTFDLFTKMTKFYQALGPYKLKLMEEAATKGLPLIRHMMMEFFEDPTTHNLNQQFMLGDEFLVAPVVTEGATTVKLYLPKGEWVELWTKDELMSEGGCIEREAPIGQPTVFYRKGSSAGEELTARMNQLNIL